MGAQEVPVDQVSPFKACDAFRPTPKKALAVKAPTCVIGSTSNLGLRFAFSRVSVGNMNRGGPTMLPERAVPSFLEGGG